MSRTHPAEKIHGDYGGQADCQRFARVRYLLIIIRWHGPIGAIKDRATIDDYFAWSRRKPALNYRPNQ